MIDPGAGRRPEGDVVVAARRERGTGPRFHRGARALAPRGRRRGQPSGRLRPRSPARTTTIRWALSATSPAISPTSVGGYHLAAAEGTIGDAERSCTWPRAARARAPADVRRLDLAHRLHCAGALFVAEPEAVAEGLARAWRVPSPRPARTAGRWSSTGPRSRRSFRCRRSAGPRRRAATPARRWWSTSVIGPETPTDEALATIRGVLTGRLGDLALRVQVDAGHPGQAEIAAALAADERARLAPLLPGRAVRGAVPDHDAARLPRSIPARSPTCTSWRWARTRARST